MKKKWEKGCYRKLEFKKRNDQFLYLSISYVQDTYAITTTVMCVTLPINSMTYYDSYSIFPG